MDGYEERHKKGLQAKRHYGQNKVKHKGKKSGIQSFDQKIRDNKHTAHDLQFENSAYTEKNKGSRILGEEVTYCFPDLFGT